MITTLKYSQHPQWRHALVIGASITGLLAARVLSDYFEQVTVIERDQLPPAVQARKGVPQGKHLHLLLNKGADIIGEFFPDLFPLLEADGALLLHPSNDFHWFQYGEWKLQFSGALRLYGQSRPLLEHHISRLVANRSNVRILDGCEVLSLVEKSSKSHGITGILLRHQQAKQGEEYIETNLVVDASGRGSQTPRWLRDLGYSPVEETRIKISVGYASRLYRRPNTAFHWKVLGINPWPLDSRRSGSGYVFPIEGNRWFVTLSGYLQSQPPADEASFLAFARELAKPDLYEAIKNAEPLSSIAIYKIPADRWCHYERTKHPDGLIVLGDAVCSFNPTYGQGMTVAALEAQLLWNGLRRQRNMGTMKGFPRRFQGAVARLLKDPWLLATSEDLRYPEVEGKRFFGLGTLQHYTRRVGHLTTIDPFAAETFYEVMNMEKSPSALFHPRILLPALLGSK